MMNVKNILQPTPDERLIKDGFRRLGVLSRKDSAADIVGVMGMMQEARFDLQETDVFIVQCPDMYTSEKFHDIAAFDRACLAGNVLATDLRKNSYDELMCKMDWDKKHVRHLSQRLDRFVRGQMENSADHEAILAALRHEGQQVSQDLAGALEYRYYQLLRDFINVGSVYRRLPDNTKVALIVDRDTLIDLASGYKSGYSSVQEAKDLGLGVYGFRTEPVADVLEQMKRSQEQVWEGDPAREMIRAGLLHAEYKLPEAPIEHCQENDI